MVLFEYNQFKKDMEKNKSAQALANLRYAKMTPEEREKNAERLREIARKPRKRGKNKKSLTV